MIPFRKQRETIGNFLLQRQLKKQHRHVQMKKISDLKNAGIFFDADSERCLKSVKTFIKKLQSQGTEVRALGYFNIIKPEKNFISDKTLYFSTLKDFSYFFLPKSEEVIEFTSAKPDALFVFSTCKDFAPTAVLKLSKAGLKIGFAGVNDDALDLTFELPGYEPEKLIEQIERYLGN